MYVFQGAGIKVQVGSKKRLVIHVVLYGYVLKLKSSKCKWDYLHTSNELWFTVELMFTFPSNFVNHRYDLDSKKVLTTTVVLYT